MECGREGEGGEKPDVVARRRGGGQGLEAGVREMDAEV